MTAIRTSHGKILKPLIEFRLHDGGSERIVLMAPHEVVKIIDILLRYCSEDRVAVMLRDLKSVTIDKEYQAVIARLEAELNTRK
jgi:hypothetical protein